MPDFYDLPVELQFDEDISTDNEFDVSIVFFQICRSPCISRLFTRIPSIRALLGQAGARDQAKLLVAEIE